jgi:MFS family permease
LLASIYCWGTATVELTTVLGKLLFDVTGREIDLGWLGLAEFAPSAILVFVSGTIADRVDRRRLGTLGLAGMSVAAFAIAWYVGTDATSTIPIFALVVVLGTARAFALPAVRSLPADTLPASRLPWYAPRQSAMFQASVITGPVLGGFLYVVDVRLAVLSAAVLFALSAVFVAAVRVTRTTTGQGVRQAEQGVQDDAHDTATAVLLEPSPGAPASGPLLREALEGLRFVRGHAILLGAISLDLFAVLFGGAIALLPAIADQRLGVGAVGLGWLRASAGIGAGVVTIVLSVRPLRHRIGSALLIAVGVFGAGTIVLGLTTSYVIAFIALAVLSAADAVSVFIRSTLVPLVTPFDKRGRVLAVEAVFVGASNELGAFESGVTGQLLGPAAAVVIGGAATLGVATAWWTLFPALRRVDRFPESVNELSPQTDDVVVD